MIRSQRAIRNPNASFYIYENLKQKKIREIDDLGMVACDLTGVGMNFVGQESCESQETVLTDTCCVISALSHDGFNARTVPFSAGLLEWLCFRGWDNCIPAGCL